MLELIISVTILALFLGVIFGTIRLASRSWEVGEKRVEGIQRTRASYDLISEDIKSIFPTEGIICPELKGCNKKAPLFIGEAERIKFVASNPGLRLSKNRYRIVSYYLEFDPNINANVIMMEERFWLFPDFFTTLDGMLCSDCEDEEFETPTYVYPLYPNIEELRFEYYGKRNAESEADWYETWNPLEVICTCDVREIERMLPQKIRINIVLADIEDEDLKDEDKEISFVVPVTGSIGIQ